MSNAQDQAPDGGGPSRSDGFGALLREGLGVRFALLLLGVWLNAADTLVTVTVMPSVAQEVGGYAYFGWASAAFLLGAITAGASGGYVSGQLGLRRAMGLGAVLYAAGCAADALAPDITFFLVGRLVQGIGAGWIIALAFVAVGAVFPERFWARVFSSISAVWGVATVLGPLVGGVFAGAGLWRGAFWFFAVQGGLYALAAVFLLPPARGTAPRSIPWRPLSLVTLSICLVGISGLLSLPLVSAALILAGLAILYLALRIDAAAPHPMLPRQALRIGTPAGAGFATMFLLQGAVIAWSVFGPMLLQAADGVSPLVAGYVVSGESIGWTGAALLVSGLRGPWPRRLIRFGPGFVVAGLLVLGPAIAAPGVLWALIPSLLIGLGFGLSWSFLSRAVLSSLDASERALGSSAIPTVQMIGNAVGAAAANALADLIGLGRAVSAAEARGLAPVLFLTFTPIAVLGWAAANRAVAAARADASKGGPDPEGRLSARHGDGSAAGVDAPP